MKLTQKVKTKENKKIKNFDVYNIFEGSKVLIISDSKI